MSGAILEPYLTDAQGEEISISSQIGFFVPSRAVTEQDGQFKFALVLKNTLGNPNGGLLRVDWGLRVINSSADGKPTSRRAYFLIDSPTDVGLRITQANGQIAEVGKPDGVRIEVEQLKAPPEGQPPVVYFSVLDATRGILLDDPTGGVLIESESFRDSEGNLTLAAIAPLAGLAAVRFVPRGQPGVRLVRTGATFGSQFPKIAIGDPEVRFVWQGDTGFKELAGIMPVLREDIVDTHKFFIEQLRPLDTDGPQTSKLLVRDISGNPLQQITGGAAQTTLTVALNKVMDAEPDLMERASVFRSSTSKPILALSSTFGPEEASSVPTGYDVIQVPLLGSIVVEGIQVQNAQEKAGQEKQVPVVQMQRNVFTARARDMAAPPAATFDQVLNVAGVGAAKYVWTFGGTKTAETKTGRIVLVYSTAADSLATDGTYESPVVLHVDADARRTAFSVSLLCKNVAGDKIATSTAMVTVASPKLKILNDIPSPVTQAWLSALKVKDDKTFVELAADPPASYSELTLAIMKTMIDRPGNVQAEIEKRIGTTAEALTASRIVVAIPGNDFEQRAYAQTLVLLEESADWTSFTKNSLYGTLMHRGSFARDIPELKILMLHELQQVDTIRTINSNVIGKIKLQLAKFREGFGGNVIQSRRFSANGLYAFVEALRFTQDLVNIQATDASFSLLTKSVIQLDATTTEEDDGIPEILVSYFNQSLKYLTPQGDFGGNTALVGGVRSDALKELRRIKARLEEQEFFKEVVSLFQPIPEE